VQREGGRQAARRPARLRRQRGQAGEVVADRRERARARLDRRHRPEHLRDAEHGALWHVPHRR